MTKTQYTARSTVAEIRVWLEQFPADAPVFVGGGPAAGYIAVGEGNDERMFALYDEEQAA